MLKAVAMETLKSAFDTDNVWYYWAAGAGVLATSVVAYRFLRRSGPKNASSAAYPPDTVILHQFGRARDIPSLSSLVVKLETYLRMAKIPYQPKLYSTFGKKGKIPWIEYNGEEVADSEFCMAYLNTKLGVNLNQNLTPAEKAVAKSFQIMVDEHTYWTYVYFRWTQQKGMKTLKENFQMPFFAWWMATRKVHQQLWAQGMGRHSVDEVKAIRMSDIKALSDFIGTKAFLMGDKPCQEDAAVFGFLAQLVFVQSDAEIGNCVKDKFPNLVRYCHRMKETFWPDWEDCIKQK